MPTCLTCGSSGAPGALFCASCGSRLVAKPATPGIDRLVGQTLRGTYFIEQKLGSGGMGDVYKAIHQKLDAPVALKIVKRELLGHPAIVHRFEREARAASRLRHPNVVAVTDFGQIDDGTMFMVMEYVAGKSLASIIESDAPMDERRVVRIGAQVLSALAEAHANDILHRDLKPENVMIEARRDAPDFVKVLDFGIAKVLAPGAGSSTLTQAGLVCGTPGYMSPEQLRGTEVDARSDLFSVGVVLYEMLTHKLPFDVATPMEMLHRHLSEPILPPSERGALRISRHLEELVLEALSPVPDRRPASAAVMRERLLASSSSEASGEHAAEESLTTEVLRPRPQAKPAPAAAPPEPPVTPSPKTPPAMASAQRRAPPGSRSEAPQDQGPATRTARSVPPRSGSALARGTPAPSATRAATARGTASPDRTRTLATAAPGAGTRRGSTGGGTGRVDPALLKRIEDRIANLLGPVAPHLVKKISRDAGDLEEICEKLAAYIRSPAERKQFLGWAAGELGPPAGARTRTATVQTRVTPASAWDAAVLDRAARDLAVHLGPVARVIVRRVCTQARSPGELYELLAREIPTDREREEFRRRAPALR